MKHLKLFEEYLFINEELHYKKEIKGTDYKYVEYSFTLEGNSINIGFNAEVGRHEIAFSVNDRMEVNTYNGNILRLFVAIRKIIMDYIEEYKPGCICYIPYDFNTKNHAKKFNVFSKLELPGYKKKIENYVVFFWKINPNISESFNYDYIIKTLSGSTYGWGNAISTKIEDFENSDEFKSPENDNDYILQFDKYLRQLDITPKSHKNNYVPLASRYNVAPQEPISWYGKST